MKEKITTYCKLTKEQIKHDEELLKNGRTHREDGTIIGGKYDKCREYDVAGWKPDK